jgi:hypothetical protein
VQDIKSLVDWISKYRIKSIETLAPPSANKKLSSYQKLFKALRTGKIESDADAIRLLNMKSSGEYRVFKSRFKKKLLNTLHFVEPSLGSKATREKARLSKQVNNLVTLQMFGVETRTRQKLAKDIIRDALKYDYYEPLVIASSALRTSYTSQGNKKDFVRINKIIEDVTKKYLAELRVRGFREEIDVEVIANAGYKENLGPKIIEFIREAESLFQEYRTPRLQYFLSNLKMLKAHWQRDWESVHSEANNALEHVKENELLFGFMPRVYLSLVKAEVYLIEGQAEQAIRFCKFAVENTDFKSINRIVCLTTLMGTEVFAGHYSAACLTLNLVKEAYEIAPKIYAGVEERNKITTAYLHYVNRADGLGLTIGDGKPFRIHKFVNEVPAYSKDKRGMNVAILILQILWMLEEENLSGIIDRMESLVVYSDRWLRKEYEFRSIHFIRMLNAMEKSEFDPTETRKRASKYYRKLQESNFRYNGGTEEMEIIPYEKLWTRIMGKIESLHNPT